MKLDDIVSEQEAALSQELGGEVFTAFSTGVFINFLIAAGLSIFCIYQLMGVVGALFAGSQPDPLDF